MLQEELHAIAALCCLFKSESFIILIFLSFCFVFFFNFFKNNNEWLKYFDSKYFNSKVGISLTKSEKSNSSYFWGGKLSAPHIIDLLLPRCMVFFSVRKRNYTHFHQFIWMSMLFISERHRSSSSSFDVGPLQWHCYYSPSSFSLQLLICIPKKMVRKTNSLNVMIIVEWSIAFAGLMTNAGGWILVQYGSRSRGNQASYLFRERISNSSHVHHKLCTDDLSSCNSSSISILPRMHNARSRTNECFITRLV